MVQHTCIKCTFTISNKRKFFQHIETHTEDPVSCIKCKQSFNCIISFNWHLSYLCNKTSKRVKFKCNSCPRSFLTKRNLLRHVEGHKRNNCTYCGALITNRKSLIKHLYNTHAIKWERTLYKCDYCDKRYVKKQSVCYHMRQHFADKHVCLCCGCICDTIVDYEEHMQWHNSKKLYKCTRCNESFSSKHHHRFHIARHDRFKCVSCNESYASRKNAVHHQQMGHLVEGLEARFICPHCPLEYTTKNYLKNHLQKHLDVDCTSVTCKTCNEPFQSLNDYFKHCIKIPHASKAKNSKISCSVCNEILGNQYLIKQHNFKYHRTSNKQIKCQYCDYQTMHKSNLKRHRALHFSNGNQFICDRCGKKFSAQSSLEDHISYSHLLNKMFKCEICDKSFKRNSELIRHRSSHSSNRPHVCSTCGKSYKQITHLRRHEKITHNITFRSKKIANILN